MEFVPGPEGPDVLGPVHNCTICNQPLCYRFQPCCSKCAENCWLCGTVKADENCDRCRRAARKLLASTGKGAAGKHARLSAIVRGAEGISQSDARKLLKHSGYPNKRIYEAAGGGAAGNKALKRAALVWSSKMQQVSQNGGNVLDYYAPRQLAPHSHSLVITNPRAMTASVAIDAVGGVKKTRWMEPIQADVPAKCLAIAAELIDKAGNGVTDALILADLANSLKYVRGAIVEKVQKRRTHAHGWDRTVIESLERFARDETNRAISRVLARAPEAVAERQAKAPPKKKLRRAKSKKRKAAMKDGTHVPKFRCTGDTKKIVTKKRKERDQRRVVKDAYNKVEKYGADACYPHEVAKHAEYEARAKKVKAKDEARRRARRPMRHKEIYGRDENQRQQDIS